MPPPDDWRLGKEAKPKRIMSYRYSVQRNTVVSKRNRTLRREKLGPPVNNGYSIITERSHRLITLHR
jgi:hypothetical protein